MPKFSLSISQTISNILDGSPANASNISLYLDSIPEDLVPEALQLIFSNFGEKEFAEATDDACDRSTPRATVAIAILSQFSAIGFRMQKDDSLVPLFLSHWANIKRWMRSFLGQLDQARLNGIPVDSTSFKERWIAMLTGVFVAISMSPAAQKAICGDRDALRIAARLWLVEGSGVCHAMTCGARKAPRPPFILRSLMKSDSLETILDKRHVVISEAGGVGNLADILIRRINAVIDPRNQLLDLCSFHASLLELRFLLPTDTDHLLLETLLKSNVIMGITGLLRTLTKLHTKSGFHGQVAIVVSEAFAFIHDFVESFSGAREIRQAIDSGILTAILHSAPHLSSCTLETETRVNSLLTKVLARYLIYPSVIGSAATAFKKIAGSMHRRVRGTALNEAWELFTALLLDRMVVRIQILESVTLMRCSYVSFPVSI